MYRNELDNESTEILFVGCGNTGLEVQVSPFPSYPCMFHDHFNSVFLLLVKILLQPHLFREGIVIGPWESSLFPDESIINQMVTFVKGIEQGWSRVSETLVNYALVTISISCCWNSAFACTPLLIANKVMILKKAGENSVLDVVTISMVGTVESQIGC